MTTTEPATYCRIFAVGPACAHPCAECKRSNLLLTDADRDILLAPYFALRAALASHGECE